MWRVSGVDSVTKFSEVTGKFVSENLPVLNDITDGTGKLFHMLQISQPVFSKPVQAYLSLTLRSIDPELPVSFHIILKGPKQSSYSRETINSQMYIGLKNEGTAHFDPRQKKTSQIQSPRQRIAQTSS